MICRPARLLAVVAALLAMTSMAQACPDAAQGYGRLGGPNAAIAVRLGPGAVKVGEFFGATVVVCRTPVSEPVQTIVVDALMPEHGHGMNYRPTVTQTGPDTFEVSGLMLHMPGMWTLNFDIVQGDRRTRLALFVPLKP